MSACTLHAGASLAGQDKLRAERPAKSLAEEQARHLDHLFAAFNPLVPLDEAAFLLSCSSQSIPGFVEEGKLRGVDISAEGKNAKRREPRIYLYSIAHLLLRPRLPLQFLEPATILPHSRATFLRSEIATLLTCTTKHVGNLVELRGAQLSDRLPNVPRPALITFLQSRELEARRMFKQLKAFVVETYGWRGGRGQLVALAGVLVLAAALAAWNPEFLQRAFERRYVVLICLWAVDVALNGGLLLLSLLKAAAARSAKRPVAAFGGCDPRAGGLQGYAVACRVDAEALQAEARPQKTVVAARASQPCEKRWRARL